LLASPFRAAAVTNDVAFTTAYSGFLYPFNAATGAIFLKTPLSAGSNAPVTIDGGWVIAGAGVAVSPGEQSMIIADKLGGKGKLPDTVSARGAGQV
jgi:hypothetical protein